MLVHGSRILAVDTTTPAQVWFTKEIIPPAPAEFSSLQFLNIDPAGGGVTALGSLDGKIVLWKSDRIFVEWGRGPDGTGAQDDFDGQPVPSDCGCAVPKSVVLTPIGLMFQSAKGFYLLDRSLQFNYIGADVETYNGQTATSAVLIANTNQVRFTLGNGTALVYDYQRGQWSVFTNISAVDATLWNGVYVYAGANGTVQQETAGVYSDNGSFIAMRVVTGHLSLAGVQGLQRVYDALILGEYASDHKLRVKVAYDYSSSFTQTDDITVVGSTVPYQFRIQFNQQKCEALQLSIEDISTGTIGEGMSLSALEFDVGVKRGGYKPPASRSFG
jgi:hypothetical protein